jgi:hypothetical protein
VLKAKKKTCTHPGCKVLAFIKGLCPAHWRAKYAKPLKRTALKSTPVKHGKKLIKPISCKQSMRMRLYMEKQKPWLQEHDKCEAKLEGCLVDSHEVHHMEGRIGAALLDETTWLAVCPPCHRKIEDNPAMAYARGLSRKRNYKK